MYKIKVKLSNSEFANINIERPELIYGATAVLSSELDSSLTALNPVTNKIMPIININGETNRFLTPLHNEKDYKIALEHNTEMVQAIAPYFLGENEETPRDDIKTQTRHSIVAVIENEETGEYLCEDAKGRSCKSFVMGGIEEGEAPEEAAIREIYEETGYNDITITDVSKIKVVNHFYAGYKGVNRYAYLSVVFGKLNTNSHEEIDEKEQAKHQVVWLKKENLKNFINNQLNKYALNILNSMNEKDIYTGDGVMITDDKNNSLSNLEVRIKIINKYCKQMIDNNIIHEELLEKILSDSKKNKVYILGHIKSDADSIFSSYLLSNILKSMNIDSEFSILEKDYEYCDSDRKLINDFLKVEPIIVKDIEDKKFILVDHNNLFNLNKENVIGAIDHHRITGEVDNLIEIEYASTALLIYDLFKNKYKFSDKEKELIYLSVLADTDYLCSSRFKDEDKELLDELNIDIDVNKLQKEYFTITDFENNIKDNLNSNYKEYNFDNKNIKRTLICGYKEHYNKYYNIYLDYIKNEKDYLIIWCDFETKKTYIHINNRSIELDYILTSTVLILDMLKERGLLV